MKDKDRVSTKKDAESKKNTCGLDQWEELNDAAHNMFCIGFVIISKTKCKDILLMFKFRNVKKKNTTKTHAYILILYFETCGFKYDERIASKDVAIHGDGSWHRMMSFIKSMDEKA